MREKKTTYTLTENTANSKYVRSDDGIHLITSFKWSTCNSLRWKRNTFIQIECVYICRNTGKYLVVLCATSLANTQFTWFVYYLCYGSTSRCALPICIYRSFIYLPVENVSLRWSCICLYNCQYTCSVYVFGFLQSNHSKMAFSTIWIE